MLCSSKGTGTMGAATGVGASCSTVGTEAEGFMTGKGASHSTVRTGAVGTGAVGCTRGVGAIVVSRDEVIGSEGAGGADSAGLEAGADGDTVILGVDTLRSMGTEEADPTPGAMTDADVDAEGSSTVRCFTEDLLEMYFSRFNDLQMRPSPSLISYSR
jgi:hypothetical protein